MPIRERMGMGASAVTREDESVGGNQSESYRWKRSGKVETFMKELFIMEREFVQGKILSCDDCSDTGMAVREFFSI